MARISEPISIVSPSETSSSDFSKGIQSPLTFWLVACGGIGAALFTLTYLIEGVTRPAYAAWQQPISALSLGPGGWMQQGNFILFGVLLVVSSAGWYRLLAPGSGAFWFPMLQGLGGLGLIGAGVFSMDPFPGYPPGTTSSATTTHGMLHTTFAFMLMIALAVGCFALGARFWNGTHQRGWAVYSWISGALMLIFWWAFIEYATSPVAGLVERIAAGSHALWVCALVALLFYQRRQRVAR